MFRPMTTFQETEILLLGFIVIFIVGVTILAVMLVDSISELKKGNELRRQLLRAYDQKPVA